jgi:hypothetical protein
MNVESLNTVDIWPYGHASNIRVQQGVRGRYLDHYPRQAWIKSPAADSSASKFLGSSGTHMTACDKRTRARRLRSPSGRLTGPRIRIPEDGSR